MTLKKAIVLRENITDIHAFDQQDSIIQSQEVQKALLENGYEACIVPFSIYIEDLKKKIEEIQPEFVFNLVDGDFPLLYLAPLYLEHLQVPFTGCSSEAIFITTHKVFAKKLLKSAHIPTPKYISKEDSLLSLEEYKGKLFIIKPSSLDASLFIGKEAVIEADSDDNIMKAILEKKKNFKKEFFAEEFIQGREINVGMIGTQEECFVLHPAEIQFLNYPEGKHKVLDYAAKWEESSFEYKNTVRTFDFKENDKHLLEEIKKIAIECWKLFGLNGYARLDLRINEQGCPFVLEVNSNPNISTSGGFAAACKHLGWSYNEMIQKIVSDINKS